MASNKCRVCHCTFKTKFENFTKNQQGYNYVDRKFFQAFQQKRLSWCCVSQYLGKCWNSSGSQQELLTSRLQSLWQKICNLGSLNALTHKETRKPEEVHRGKPKRCQQRAKTREKDYFASVPQPNNGIYNPQHKLQRCQTQRSNTQITAEIMQTYDLLKFALQHDLTVLVFSL